MPDTPSAMSAVAVSMMRQRDILTKLATGASVVDILGSVKVALSERFEDSTVSIVLRGANRQVSCIGSNIPTEMTDALAKGYAGTSLETLTPWFVAMEENRDVIINDVVSDPVWRHLRPEFQKRHMVACWSYPIVDSRGNVEGTFVIWHKMAGRPGAHDEQILEMYGYVSGLAIEKNRLDEENRRLWQQDFLTGLPNRRVFFEQLDQQVRLAKQSHEALSVVMIDLDHFKDINDAWGHAMGDEVIQTMARRLNECLRENELLARLGGDEFVVLLPKANCDDARALAAKVLRAARAPIELPPFRFRVSASLGVATFPRDGTSSRELMMSADAAMYEAKGKGRNRAISSEPEMHEKSLARLTIASEIDMAIDNHEFQLYFQPRVDKQGIVRSCEALIRWNHPTRGLLLPADFIPLAEESGKIVEVGNVIIRESCRQIRSWMDDSVSPVRIAINVSPLQFGQDMITTFHSEMERFSIDGRWLEIEITETVLFQYEHKAYEILTGLKRLGLHITLDNFGTGYSSFRFLHRFPVDTVKMDKSFVQGTPTDTDRSIVTAIVSLSKSLRLNLIAEGVESTEQLDLLDEQGCDVFQGYLFTEPMNSAEFTDRLREGARVFRLGQQHGVRQAGGRKRHDVSGGDEAVK